MIDNVVFPMKTIFISQRVAGSNSVFDMQFQITYANKVTTNKIVASTRTGVLPTYISLFTITNILFTFQERRL